MNRQGHMRISTKLMLQRGAHPDTSGKGVGFLLEYTTFITPCIIWQGSGAETRVSEEKPTTNFL
jgi:hypothetical protein